MAPATTFSQPANTGGGRQRFTQLAVALEKLKSESYPVSLTDFAVRNEVEQLLHDEELLASFQADPRVIYNERNDTWAWRPDHDIRTPQDLLNLVERRYLDSIPPQPLGFKLADLRDSYPASREAVDAFAKKRPASEVRDEVERQGSSNGEAMLEHESKKLLLIPGAREGTIRQVFFNEASSESYIKKNDGRIIGTIDDEFKTLWHSLSVPDEVDLPRELEQEGHIAATMVAGDVLSANARGRGRGRGKGRGTSRRIRTQNTHIEGLDLSSNYQG